jgi:hypothetical protein
MTKKQFLHKCAGMQTADIADLAKSVLTEAQASTVINALLEAEADAAAQAGFYVTGFKTVFTGYTVEAYGDNNYGCYAAIEL